MSAILSPRLGVVLLLAIATTFGANHVAARVAFDHGASVATAVAVRSGFTALAVLALLRLQGIALALPAATLGRAALVGVVLAVQSYCLYSAVALIPAALALLAFNTFPMLLALMSWAAGGERPTRRALVAMPVALAGLALALDVFGQQVGLEGILWALGAAFAFALALFLIAHWLKEVDGRVRTFLTMSVAAVVVLAGGGALGGFALPASAAGWGALALLTVFYGVAITALFIVLPHVGAVSNAVVLNFEPITVLALAWVVLGQTMAALQIVGAFIVVGAVAWLGTAKR